MNKNNSIIKKQLKLLKNKKDNLKINNGVYLDKR